MRGTMNAEQKRIAIAELCGIENTNAVCWRGHLKGIEVRIPDYLNDLNAVHEAEEVILKQGLQDTWLDCLVEVVVGKNVHWSDYHCFPQVSRATAEQRADAILLVMERAGS